jgi:hypothetical protein
VVMSVFFCGLTLRLRHQIVTLALLPDTVFHTRLSAIYQVPPPALSSNPNIPTLPANPTICGLSASLRKFTLFLEGFPSDIGG